MLCRRKPENVRRSSPEQSGECQSIWQSAIHIAVSPVTSLKANFGSIVGFHDSDDLRQTLWKSICARKAEEIVFLTIAKVEVYCTLCLTNSVVMENVQSFIGSQLMVYMSSHASERPCRWSGIPLPHKTMFDLAGIDINGISC